MLCFALFCFIALLAVFFCYHGCSGWLRSCAGVGEWWYEMRLELGMVEYSYDAAHETLAEEMRAL